MAEQICAAGVPVFAADIKGDLSGIASPGQPNDKLLTRTGSQEPARLSSSPSAARAMACRCA
jgi:hypothetical protein